MFRGSHFKCFCYEKFKFIGDLPSQSAEYVLKIVYPVTEKGLNREEKQQGTM